MSSDFFHSFPCPLLENTFEHDEARDDLDSVVVEKRNGLVSVDREEHLEDEDKAAVVKDSNSESVFSLFPAEIRAFSKTSWIFSTLIRSFFITSSLDPSEVVTAADFAADGGGYLVLKKGTLEHLGACIDALEVTPVNARGDVSRGLGDNAHVTTEVGKTFIVSTMSVKIMTW